MTEKKSTWTNMDYCNLQFWPRIPTRDVMLIITYFRRLLKDAMSDERPRYLAPFSDEKKIKLEVAAWVLDPV